jgi:hypothetical protein
MDAQENKWKNSTPTAQEVCLRWNWCFALAMILFDWTGELIAFFVEMKMGARNLKSDEFLLY